MKTDLLPLLLCPDCSGEIVFARLENYPKDGQEIDSGTLTCKKCGHEFPILSSVPRLLPHQELEKQMRKTRQRFGWEWERYPGALEEDRRIFLEETQIPEANWKSRRCMDAGCGMGRYAGVALELGAEVVACDISDALLRLIPRARKERRLHLIQADLMHPPFKPGTFDIVYSQGVIHHTPDTQATFRKLAPLVKKRGQLSVWVYGTPGSYRSFSSNPLRSDRTWLKSIRPLVWALVWLRQGLSDFLRFFTTRLPTPLLYILCYPLTAVGAIPLVKYLTYSVHPNFRVRLIENFDWLAPPFQHKHTKEEMRSWFESEGFSDLHQLAHGMVPKVGFVGTKAGGEGRD